MKSAENEPGCGLVFLSRWLQCPPRGLGRVSRCLTLPPSRLPPIVLCLSAGGRLLSPLQTSSAPGTLSGGHESEVTWRRSPWEILAEAYTRAVWSLLPGARGVGEAGIRASPSLLRGAVFLCGTVCLSQALLVAHSLDYHE